MIGGIHKDILLPHTDTYELYHNDLSLCSKKVRVCMAELGIPYKSHHIDLIETGSYENIGRDFLAVNPAGLVPVLVHNGHPIYESREIIRYLAREAGSYNALLPANERDMAVMQQWVDNASLVGDDPTEGMDTSAANCVAVLTTPLFCAGVREIPVHRIVEGLLFHRIRSRPLLFLLFKMVGLRGLTKLRPLMSELGRARTKMFLHLDDLEAHLAEGGPYIVGDVITLADISWLVIFERLVEADWLGYFLDPRTRPELEAYWQRLRATVGYQFGIEEHRHPTVAAATRLIQQQKRE